MLLFQSLNENLEPLDPPQPIPFFCFERINLGLQFLIPCVVLSVFGHELTSEEKEECLKILQKTN